ncbi:MAG: sugar ABC transporter permease [Cellulomonas sp.]|nr:sugar ABC transporter permease [Cellulomonas sp.]
MSATATARGPAAISRGPARPRTSALRRSQQRWGLMLAAPAALLVLTFSLFPTLQGVWYSFTDWDGRSAQWVGLDNYAKGLLGNPEFVRILLNNLAIVASVPIGVAGALVIAFLLAQGTRGSNLFRSIYFLPVALSWVVIGITWSYLLSDRGPINGVLRTVGLGALAQDWLGQVSTSLLALILVFNWSYLGINVVLLYTGMVSLDPSVMEAARLDGASGVRLVRHIVVPHVRRYVELSTILTMSAAITQIFGLIYTMTNGGPGVSTTTLEFQLYTTAFKYGRFAQGAALGVVLFLFTLMLTLVRIRSGVRRGDDE